MDGEKNGKTPMKKCVFFGGEKTTMEGRKHPKRSFLVGKTMVVGYHHLRKHPHIRGEGPSVSAKRRPRESVGAGEVAKFFLQSWVPWIKRMGIFFPSQNKKQIKQTRWGGGKEHQTFDFFVFLS